MDLILGHKSKKILASSIQGLPVNPISEITEEIGYFSQFQDTEGNLLSFHSTT